MMDKCEAILCDSTLTIRYIIIDRYVSSPTMQIITEAWSIMLCEKHANIHKLYCENQGLDFIKDTVQE